MICLHWIAQLEKLYWKIYLTNQQEPDQASSSLFMFKITYDTSLADKREKLELECKRALLKKFIFSSGVDD